MDQAPIPVRQAEPVWVEDALVGGVLHLLDRVRFLTQGRVQRSNIASGTRGHAVTAATNSLPEDLPASLFRLVTEIFPGNASMPS